MPGSRLVIWLVNDPIPLPSEVCALETVGLCPVLQHTPRAVTVAFPLSVTFPPQEADVEPMFKTLLVVTVGLVRTITVTSAVLEQSDGKSVTVTV